MDTLKHFKSNQHSRSFCFNTFYLENEPSLRGPVHPMQPPIRVHSSHDTEQGDIDCFHFTGVIWDWHIMKAQQGSENKEKSIYASKQSLFTISCKLKKRAYDCTFRSIHFSHFLYFQKYPFLPFRLINSSLIFLLSDCWWIIGYLVPKETPTQTHKIVNRLLFDLEKMGL